MSFGGCFTAAQEAEAIQAGFASDPSPDKCRCHGGGWILSDSDVWFQCPEHFNGQMDPETAMYAEMEEDEYYDGRAEEVASLRASYFEAKVNPEGGF